MKINKKKKIPRGIVISGNSARKLSLEVGNIPALPPAKSLIDTFQVPMILNTLRMLNKYRDRKKSGARNLNSECGICSGGGVGCNLNVSLQRGRGIRGRG